VTFKKEWSSRRDLNPRQSTESNKSNPGVYGCWLPQWEREDFSDIELPGIQLITPDGMSVIAGTSLTFSNDSSSIIGKFVSKLMHWLTQHLLCLPFFRVILGLPEIQ